MAYADAVLWVLLFAAIAVGGLVMVICYAVWLAHKTSDVYSEVAVLGRQAQELAELAGQVGAPQDPRGRHRDRDLAGPGDRQFRTDVDVG